MLSYRSPPLSLEKQEGKMPGNTAPPAKEAVIMNKSYNMDTSTHLKGWFNQMMIGYKVTHPFSTLNKQIVFYRDKMAEAEKEVKKEFHTDDKNA